ncbi:NACHT domain-containing protein [Sphaerothrix gracilis]|uniref:NACHT domain-containing protein n=1 Tax=Sphaerothrix gracilis TaxID=3151835 RepID=UPI0031FDAE14
MSNRQRGVVLTEHGQKRLEAAISSAQDEVKFGKRFTQEEISERARLSIKTIKKIRSCRDRVDKASLCDLFKAFGLELIASDFGQPEESITTSDTELTCAKLSSILIDITSKNIDTKLEASIKETIDLVQDNIQSKEAESLLGVSNKFYDSIRNHCREKILYLYSEIKLLNHYKIRVENIYVDTYVLEGIESGLFATVPDLVKTETSISSFERIGLGLRKKRISGLDAVKKFPRLMVLGKPGVGKSTYLRFLAVACSQEKIFKEKIPILIELRSLENPNSLNINEIICRETGLKNVQDIENAFSEGKFFILLDGLDELSQSQREHVQRELDFFIQIYYKNRFVITCRTQTTEFLMDKFVYVEIASFNSTQICEFSKNWFVSQFGSKGDQLHDSFINKLNLPKNKRNAELATTPILLSLICWIYSDTGKLPEKKHKLYEKGLDLLLEKWDEARGIHREVNNEAYKPLSKEDKQNLFSCIAFEKFSKKQRILFELEELCEQIANLLRIKADEAQSVLKEIEFQHGIIIERAQDIYSFSHLTFQEYFVARKISKSDFSENFRVVQKNFGDHEWREVFVLLFGILKKPDEAFILIKRSIEAPILGNPKLRTFIYSIKQKPYYLRSQKKSGALRVAYLQFVLELLPYLEVIYDHGFTLNQSFANETDKPFSLDYGLLNCCQLVLSRIKVNQFTQGHYSSQLEYSFFNSFELLRKKLPDLGSAFLKWWPEFGSGWLQELRDFMNEYLEIDQYWNFSQREKDMISQFSYSSELLLICINLSDFVSLEIKRAIENALLDIDLN